MSYRILSKELSNPEFKEILQALNTFFYQKGEVEIIERVSENGSLKIETTYVLCDSVVVDSYQTYPKHL